jgi:hypothetical protein
MKHIKLIRFSVLLMILIVSLTGFYFMPFKVTDKVTVWFSNNRFRGFNEVSDYPVFIVANIVSGRDGILWRDKGLNESVYIGDVSFISLADGIIMWVNDSIGSSNFPNVGEKTSAFEDENYFYISNVRVQGSKDGTSPISVPYFNPWDDEKSYCHAYVDLGQVESILSINGNESYRLSISMDINYYVRVPAPPFLSSSPNRISEEKTVDFGNITVYCENGSHEYAQVDFPYQTFSHPVEVPYINGLFPSL